MSRDRAGTIGEAPSGGAANLLQMQFAANACSDV
jgi:hypothetical protein